MKKFQNLTVNDLKNLARITSKKLNISYQNVLELVSRDKSIGGYRSWHEAKKVLRKTEPANSSVENSVNDVSIEMNRFKNYLKESPKRPVPRINPRPCSVNTKSSKDFRRDIERLFYLRGFPTRYYTDDALI